MENTQVALIGIGVALGISILTAIIFLVLYTRLKIKNDTNIRRRVIATKSIEVKAPLITVQQPVEEIIEHVPIPQPTIVYPKPVYIPPTPPPPPPQQVIVMQPHPQPPPQPLPPPPPREPEVVVHEVIHRYEPAPAAPAPPPPRTVRRRSWGGQPDPDEWVMVKRVTKKTGKKTKVEADSSDSSSDEEEETRVKRRHKRRLDRYDLATNFVPLGFRPQPQMMAGAGYMMAQPAQMMAPTMMTAAPTMVTQPMMAAAQPTYMPYFTVPR